MKYSIINIFLSSILFFLLLGNYTLPFSIVFIGMTIIIVNSIDRNEEISHRILKTTAYIFIVIILFMILSKKVFNYDIIDNLIKTNSNLFDNSLEELKNMGIKYSKEQIEELNSIKPLLIDFFRNSIFSILLLGSLIISLVSNSLTNFIIRRKNIKILSPMKFSEFKVSIKFFIASIIILIFTYIIGKINPSIYKVLISNITIIFYFIIFIQGLSVMIYILEKFNIPKIVRYIIIFLSLFSLILGMIVFFIGMIDIIFNFRKIKGN